MNSRDARRPMHASIAALLVGAACAVCGPAAAASTRLAFSGTVTSSSVPEAMPGIDLGRLIQRSCDGRFRGVPFRVKTANAQAPDALGQPSSTETRVSTQWLAGLAAPSPIF